MTEGPLGNWLRGLSARAHRNTVIVALANKLARIAWAVLRSTAIYSATTSDPFALKEAPHCAIADLNRLLLSRAAVGRRRYAEILARRDDPGLPGPGVAVGRRRLLRPERSDDTGEQQKHRAAAEVHNAHRYLLS
jgi:hypothetical protein